jgi:hypothetical protein
VHDLDESVWANLTGGYRMPLDPRPLVARLDTDQNTESAWQELWEELHHQGDVGDASYAAVPLLVDMYRKKRLVDWNTYALIAIIDLARTETKNPPLPDWLATQYHQAIKELAGLGVEDILKTDDADTIRAILSVIALAKDLRLHAKFLVFYTDAELAEMSEEY